MTVNSIREPERDLPVRGEYDVAVSVANAGGTTLVHMTIVVRERPIPVFKNTAPAFISAPTA